MLNELIPDVGVDTTAATREVVWYQQLLRTPQVARIIGVSKPTLRRMVACGEFPRPINIHAGVRVWARLVVDAWVESKVVKQRESMRGRYE